MSTPAQTLFADRMKYPGLLPREILILKAWLAQHESEYQHFDFNVRVGAGIDPGPSFPEDVRKQAIMNTQKRIDAVGFHGDYVAIIEVKDRADAAAIGQLLIYPPLFVQSTGYSGTVRKILVCNRITPDIPTIAPTLGIEIDQVKVDFSMLSSKAR